ncbi:protein EARLY FLOWERING 5-like [Telopea speciosissima]|uniref:protein EARLY FLOWERING 5-like n=1 Tax=Telopea speciosissima TaxID=54955 RepID=UPI001CC7A396|nr:protein EARLY FLOWERING 5-like [Telopea speciosissima]
MKTTKGGKVMNPTDAYRKELRKKELKRNKKERKKVREVGILKKDPDTIRDQIGKLEIMKADGALDKARKHKKRQLEDTLNLVLKKRKEYDEKLREKGETPVMFSHLGPPRRRTAAEEEDRVKHPKPEDSVYYHPTLNPTGAPPPGKPPMYKSSIGPRIPLSEASISGAASSSLPESEDVTLAMPPPPPPLPLPNSSELGSGDGDLPSSLPVPPPPPKPVSDLGAKLPPTPLPPPPGPPSKEQISSHTPLPPPPPPQRPTQPPPPGTSGSEREKNQTAASDDPETKMPGMQPQPPPPPGLPQKSVSHQPQGAHSDSYTSNSMRSKDASELILPPPPPPRPPTAVSRPALMTTLQPDVLPPGISRFPPPPPPDMRPPLPGPGLPNRAAPPGIVVPLMPRPPFGPPPGPSLMMRPLVPPGSVPTFQENDQTGFRPAPPKPSYIKSAASTVVKKPLAQHTPELTAMVPASVRVRRETAVAKVKPKPPSSTGATVPRAAGPAVAGKSELVNASAAPKTHSIDDSYTAFLEDMKALGALDG